MAVAVTVEQQERAIQAITRALLQAIANAADADALTPGSEGAVKAVALGLVVDAATGVYPDRERVRLIAEASQLVGDFLDACAHESV